MSGPRPDRGISRGELAEALGIHDQTVGYIEPGGVRSEPAPRPRVATFFELPVEAVFSLEPIGQLGADALLARRPPATD